MTDTNKEVPWGNQDTKDNVTPTATVEEFVPMYWIHQTDWTNGNQPTIFGKQAYKTDEGFLVVTVPAEHVEGELGRAGKRLVTQEEYLQHLTEIAPKE